MQIDAITLLPDMFDALTHFGVTGRALAKGIWQFKAWNPRDFVSDSHKTVDDRPYGGGAGMVLLPEPLLLTINAIKAERGKLTGPVVYLSPQGIRLDQKKIVSLSKKFSLVLLCGRYEGIDERFIEQVVDEEISVGDFVLSGGELPAMLLMDAVLRLLPGVLHDATSSQADSFMNGLLDYPHYTRPKNFLGKKIPSILSSGHHGKIAAWRLKQSLGRTKQRRPDLLDHRVLTEEESKLLAEFEQEQSSL